ncbi:MAG: monovalent cation/H(+) antiporter subunit G [Thiohalocapsa sp.]|uniref:monovalent cation/H(+) antiporter subunit G n=1 Tax=Thiohalocapsa sp. TaxID=2497641 RepID=UPI0025F10DEF|nr:monovalent cation/H(+) antiporter subunit G [Thiohalocapsa sp.]MCG6942529.1 monovalent cation/H(+) antiporter subunit G [Thiohalocapsa sp.]
MELALHIAAAVCITLGATFFVAGTVGLLRLPDLFSRLHALTKADNLGLGLIMLGLILYAPGLFYALKLLLLWVLVMVSGATGSHLIAKRALRGDGEDLQ